MTKEIDWSKPIQLTDGRPCTLKSHEHDGMTHAYMVCVSSGGDADPVAGTWWYNREGVCPAIPGFLHVENVPEEADEPAGETPDVPPAFDPTKPVRTRGGLAARIICTDAGGEYPIVALVQNPAHSVSTPETVLRFSSDGRRLGSSRDSIENLVNIPERHELFFGAVQSWSTLENVNREFPSFPVFRVVVEGIQPISVELLPAANGTVREDFRGYGAPIAA